jgi:hypothetical protein
MNAIKKLITINQCSKIKHPRKLIINFWAVQSAGCTPFQMVLALLRGQGRAWQHHLWTQMGGSYTSPRPATPRNNR